MFIMYSAVNFHTTMNPFTRMLVLLTTQATVSRETESQATESHTGKDGRYYFLSNPILAKQEIIRSGQGMLLTKDMLMNGDVSGIRLSTCVLFFIPYYQHCVFLILVDVATFHRTKCVYYTAVS